MLSLARYQESLGKEDDLDSEYEHPSAVSGSSGSVLTDPLFLIMKTIIPNRKDRIGTTTSSCTKSSEDMGNA